MKEQETDWLRARFKANLDDPRPIKFPPPGPWWGTGFNDQNYTVVAYVKHKNQIKKFWPEAEEIEVERVPEIVFSERFPKPDWWKL